MNPKHFFLALAAIACCLLSACTSEDPEKVVFSKDQPTEITLDSDSYSGQVHFTTMAAWTASVSSDGIAPGDVTWLHLQEYRGEAGEATLSYTLDYNSSGNDRTAYIIIICEDTRVVVTIIQKADDEEGDEPSSAVADMVWIEVNRYENMGDQGFAFDGTTKYQITYSDGLPTKFVATWRDDIDRAPGSSANSDSYIINEETMEFEYSGGGSGSVSSVFVKSETVMTYYPSERKEYERSQHFAEIKNNRAVKGWYLWDEDDLRSNWEASYDPEGYLTSTKNDDGDGSGEWSTHNLIWTDRCLTRITCTEGYTTSIVYADKTLRNLHPRFDLNWILPTDLECYDFAAGDITRLLASFGFMGWESQYLMTSISETEPDGKGSVSCRMTYKENSQEKTVVTVQRFRDDVQESYSEWTIEYRGNKL